MNRRWAETLPTTLDRVWHLMGTSTRNVALATVGLDHAPEVRTVVLRIADRAAATVDIYTDPRTHKVAELAREPRASLMFWDADDRLQVRLRAQCTVLTGDHAAAEWAAVPELSHRNYTVSQPPGRLATEGSFVPHGPETHFAVLRLRVAEIETVDLGDPIHYRRAVFAPTDGWAGNWLVP